MLATYWHSTFSRTHKVVNNGINANFVFPYFCSLLLYFEPMILVNVKLDISVYKSITF